MLLFWGKKYSKEQSSVSEWIDKQNVKLDRDIQLGMSQASQKLIYLYTKHIYVMDEKSGG